MKKPVLIATFAALTMSSAMLAFGAGQPGGQPGGGGGGSGGGAGGQPPARGPGGGGRQPGGQGGAGGQRQQTVEGAMRAMGRSFEALNASIGDASKKDENLRLLGDAQRAAVGAKNARPVEAIDAAKDDAAKAAVANNFRRMMIDLVKALIDAEVATLDGKTAEARAALDKAMALEKKGHEQFRPKKEEGDDKADPMGR